MRGYDTRVVVSPQKETSMAQGDVMVVNTESRYAAPEEAAERVKTAFEVPGADIAFKKVDSTLRGNVRVEVEAALDAVGADLVLVAPAFPINGRLTACGFHLVNGKLVTDTSAGKDAERPPASDALPAFFAESDYVTEHLGVETVARGSAAVRRALESIQSDDAPVIVTCDALTDDHLAAVAAAGADLPDRCLYVGSGGLARHVHVPGLASGAGVDVDETRPVVGVAGSVAPETLVQIDEITQKRRRQLDLEMAVTEPSAAGADLASRGVEAVDDYGGVVLHSAENRGDVDRTLAAGERAGVDGSMVRRRVTDALATAAGELVHDDQPANLFLTGGATAITILNQLDAHALRMAGDAIEPGIPLASVVGGVADGAAVITKAGGFGDEQAIIKSLARIGFADE
ncbi:four-carbon acid sugar kinase family protein [Haloferax sp. MBLA0077]|uniref:Four-carbon acid sugar kinase family protein n=3 Tax=Haloferacaceae TaxID=1644056 RepID=A0A6G1Z642_9EURY|nr:four-carbon acid sugar kinase family protein [Haloferax sp. CBA1149]MRW81973.1 four-carbon acid sugar kinase family protein [Haloferax marinisediminis]